ncbi:right-handed parallel beta-helix repeat-containing protein [Kribbella koreensis]|uniref:Right-handed parallel beta-helix repeat-containing protein n=1 Tax=Kribbella koreensis TaxID=57909 RepID=A0ABN1QZW6_9ACTN
MRKLAAVPALALSAALLTAPATAHATTSAATYYVDSSAGSDSAVGTSTATAWRSLAKVNGFAFQPGDQINFKRGGSWTGTLTLSRSGTAASPIVVGAYGSGNLPVVGGPVTDCVKITGSYWFVGDLRASNCEWAGFELFGDHIVMDTVQADANAAGISIVDGSDGNIVRWSTIKDNTKMSVLTPKDVDPDDDAGAFGFLVHGNDNLISRNVIAGQYAFSYDYGFDGAAVEIFNGNDNRIEYNTTADNETFTELGRNGTGKTADGNVFGYNSVTSTKAQGGFLVTRGASSDIGPVRGTVARNNSVYLPNGDGFSCDEGCGAGILKLSGNIIKVGKKVGYEDAFDTGNPADSADEDRGVYSGSQYQFTLGPNSVKADPLFTSATNLRPKAGSPAIGRGESSDFAFDLAGKPLAGIEHLDAGAYQS